jgi:hypothetical protein
LNTKDNHTSSLSNAFVQARIVSNNPACSVTALSLGNITLQFDSGLSPDDLPGWIKILRTASC